MKLLLVALLVLCFASPGLAQEVRRELRPEQEAVAAYREGAKIPAVDLADAEAVKERNLEVAAATHSTTGAPWDLVVPLAESLPPEMRALMTERQVMSYYLRRRTLDLEEAGKALERAETLFAAGQRDYVSLAIMVDAYGERAGWGAERWIAEIERFAPHATRIRVVDGQAQARTTNVFPRVMSMYARAVEAGSPSQVSALNDFLFEALLLTEETRSFLQLLADQRKTIVPAVPAD